MGMREARVLAIAGTTLAVRAGLSAEAGAGG